MNNLTLNLIVWNDVFNHNLGFYVCSSKEKFKCSKTLIYLSDISSCKKKRKLKMPM